MTTRYLFQGSNIGINGILNDGQNVPEMLYLIQKKFFGLANVVLDRPYTGEFVANFNDSIPNAFPNINKNNLYAQNIPYSNPFIGNIGQLTFNRNAYYIDSNFSNFNYRSYNRNMIQDINSARYISCNYPYIAYYSTLLTTPLSNTFNTSLYRRFQTTYIHPLLINSISSYYDQSYTMSLFASNNTTVSINPTQGYWLVDNDSGIINFYDSNFGSAPIISGSNPPRISFFRYEGLFGEANILQGQDL